MLATNSSLLKALKEACPRETWSPPKDEHVAASSGVHRFRSSAVKCASAENKTAARSTARLLRGEDISLMFRPSDNYPKRGQSNALSNWLGRENTSRCTPSRGGWYERAIRRTRFTVLRSPSNWARLLAAAHARPKRAKLTSNADAPTSSLRDRGRHLLVWGVRCSGYQPAASARGAIGGSGFSTTGFG